MQITGITDPDGDAITVEITSVTQDEPINGLGDGDTCPDAVIDEGRVELRAERSGTGDGRVYQIEFIASDGKGSECVTDDQTLNSTGGCGGSEPGTTAGRPALDLVRTTDTEVRLEYTLGEAAAISLALYDVAGRRVSTLEAGPRAAGSWVAGLQTGRLRRGIYYAHLRIGFQCLTKAVFLGQ